MDTPRRYDLEERLVEFACLIGKIAESLPNSRTGNYLAGQLIRCGHSPAFNYGESQAAESRHDFIHKMAIVLKELKECRIAMKIIRKRSLVQPGEVITPVYNECNELVAIIAKSIKTAKDNLRKKG